MATQKAAKKPERSVYRPENQVVLGVLREFRERTGLNQVEFALRLGRSQAYVSAAERLSRLDTLQIRDWCAACGLTLVDFATEIESRLGGRKSSKPRK
jgi:transcriptional regulator with XRE-family HTH domain